MDEEQRLGNALVRCKRNPAKTKDECAKYAYQQLRKQQKRLREKFLFNIQDYLKPELKTYIQIFNIPAGSNLYRLSSDIFATIVDGLQYKEIQIRFDTDTDQWVVYKKVDDMTNRKFLLIDYDDIEMLVWEKPKKSKQNNTQTKKELDKDGL